MFYNDLRNNLIQCTFYEVLGCVVALKQNCAVDEAFNAAVQAQQCRQCPIATKQATTPS